MRRAIRWSLLLGLLGGLIWAILVPGREWWKKATTPRFLTAAVSQGRVESVVNSTGTIKPVRSVSIGAFVSGPIAHVHVDYNSMVKEGEVLAEIDPRLLKAAVDRDEAAYQTQLAERDRIRALLDQAKNNEMRAQKVRSINKDYLSDTEMDQFHFNRKSLEAQLQLANMTIKQAKANLENSQANLGYTKIVSPVSGIVIERKVDPGQTVAASFQTPELFIVAPDMDKHMHVFASVDEADIGLIREAQLQKKPVHFTVDAYPHDLFQGEIYQIRRNATTVQNVVTYPVVIEAKNPDLKLMPGMTANISFQIEVKEQVLRIPTAALRFSPPSARVRPEDKHYIDSLTTASETAGKVSATQKSTAARERAKRLVWVQEGNFLRAISVTLGLMDGQWAELIDGDLHAGQLLVTGIEGMPGR